MPWKRIYLEITNICNLSCSFCPKTKRSPRSLSPNEFGQLLAKLRGETQYLYLHVMGEPLLHPQLPDLLSQTQAFRLCLTTNGTLLSQRRDLLLSLPNLHKLSVSLHSFEGNDGDCCTPYLESVWASVSALSAQGVICALRLWNLGGRDSRNEEILQFLESKVGERPWERTRNGSFRLGDRLFLENAARFDWPDLEAPLTQTEFCLGLRDQLAILVDGSVVPCCLDHEGDLTLGNLFTEDLQSIVQGERARAIYDGFSRREAVEPLCRRCGYAGRFTK